MGQKFEIIARAVILNEGKILLCHSKARGYYFFPGGGVEFGESAEDALVREIKEELGVGFAIEKYVGSAEQIFSAQLYEDAEVTKHHEIAVVFSGKMDRITDVALEDYLDFWWVDPAELPKMTVLPESLKTAVMRWLADGQTFWVSDKRE